MTTPHPHGPCRESVSINNSLMTLGRCLEVLKANQSAPPGAAQRMIPFRESKITHLFKDVLHGGARTMPPAVDMQTFLRTCCDLL